MVADEPFVLPVRVPTKEEWVPDAKIHRCQVCKEERFNMVNALINMNLMSYFC